MENSGAALAAAVEAEVFLIYFNEMPDHRQVGKVVYGVCQTSCPLILCGVSDFGGAGLTFWVQPDGSGGLPVARFS
jgi:hypothetical protein